jgi:hypothetical protein
MDLDQAYDLLASWTQTLLTKCERRRDLGELKAAMEEVVGAVGVVEAAIDLERRLKSERETGARDGG